MSDMGAPFLPLIHLGRSMGDADKEGSRENGGVGTQVSTFCSCAADAVLEAWTITHTTTVICSKLASPESSGVAGTTKGITT